MLYTTVFYMQYNFDSMISVPLGWVHMYSFTHLKYHSMYNFF